MATKETNTPKPPLNKQTSNTRYSQLKSASRFSEYQMLMFSVVFVLIGGWLLVWAFAASTSIGTSEAEDMKLPKIPGTTQVYSDATASGGKAVKFPISDEIIGVKTLPAKATSLSLVARGTNSCGSLSTAVPSFKLYVDNKLLLSKQLSKSTWTSYTLNTNLVAGIHVIIIDVTTGGEYTFPATTSGKIGVTTENSAATEVKPPPANCTTTGYVDVLNFYGANSTTPPPIVTGVNCTPDMTWPGNNQVAASQVMDLVNNYRANNGLTRLTSSTQLTASAEWKVRQMAYYNNPNSYFFHNDIISPSINRPWYQRIMDCGYDHDLCSSSCTLHLGENMQYGTGFTAQQAFDAWLKSPEHLANIRNPIFEQTGVAVAVSKNGTVYFVQDFGALTPDRSTQGVPPPTVSGDLKPWTAGTSALTYSLNGHSSVIVNGYIYILGGYNWTQGTRTDTVYYAKLNSDGSASSWSTANSLPTTNFYLATAVAANGYIYVMGGESPNYPYATSDVYYAKVNSDGSIGTWTSNSPNSLPKNTYLASSVAYNGYIYEIGGRGDSYFSDVYYAKVNSDGSTGPWNSTQALPKTLAYTSSVVANGYLYVVGGYSGTLPSETKVYYAQINGDGSTGPWNTNSSSVPNPSGTSDAYTTPPIGVANGYIYVLCGCGRSGQNYYTQLNPDGTTDTWQSLTNPVPGQFYSPMTVYNGYLYFLNRGDSKLYYTTGGGP